ncbi:MAG: hypothetical protein HYR96_05710 [Deltaproteobacteria bacterium]|nr:hypothetical protein [Deltaproteobacteria bacterium]
MSPGLSLNLRSWVKDLKSLLPMRLFWLGLVVRIVCLPLFESHFLRDLFIPFVDRFITHPFENPWSQFPSNYFPYGPVLLLGISVFKWLGLHTLGNVALGSAPVGLTLIKLPVLLMDFFLFGLLYRLAGHQGRSLLKFYWLNPVVIYVNYVFGQLDVVSMAFCMASLYLLITGRTGWSASVFAAAALCKFHVILAVPVMMTFLWNSDFARPALKQILVWCGVAGTLVLAGFLSTHSDVRYITVGSPEALRTFAAYFDLGSAQKIYLGPMLVSLLLGYLSLTTRMTSRGLLFGVCCVFGVLLLTTSTVPSWYLWVLPFLSLYCALYHNAPRSLYWTFSGLLVAYAVVVYQWGVTLPPIVQGVAFTIVQTTLLGLTLTVWWLVVRLEAIPERRSRPLFIGIAGDSGAGKDYFVGVLQDIFSPKNTSVIEGDDYHRWERGNRKWERFTHLDPHANDLGRLDTHADDLAKGLFVQAPHYDHNVGRFDEMREIKPSPFVLVQGLHTLYLKGLRENLGLRVFLAPDPMIQLSRKIRRDVTERGHKIESVLASLDRRRIDSERHIQPQRKFADWVIEFHPAKPVDNDEILAGFEPEIMAVHVVPNDVGTLGLVNALMARGIDVTFESAVDGLDRARLSVRGELPKQLIRTVAYELFQDLRQRTRSRSEPQWRSGADGITQLIALCLLRRQPSERSYAIHQAPNQFSQRAS